MWFTLDVVIIVNRGTMFRCIQSKPYSFTTKIFLVNHRENGYLFFYLSPKSSPGAPNSFGKSNKQNHKKLRILSVWIANKYMI